MRLYRLSGQREVEFMRLIDSYFDTQEDATQEVARMKADVQDGTMIIKCERTGYGNWRVYVVLADVMVDSIFDGTISHSPHHHPGFHHGKSAWAKL